VALRRGEVDYLFADALGLALWIGRHGRGGLLQPSRAGPTSTAATLAKEVGFVLRRDDEVLRRAFDYALHRLWDEGKYAELYLRFFPISPSERGRLAGFGI
jgi:polar amino acid transport system substrate-binding protein